MRMRRTIGLSLALLIASVAAAAAAKQTSSAQHQSHPSTKAKAAKPSAPAARSAAARRRAENKPAAEHPPRQHAAARKGPERESLPDEYIGALQVVGKEEIGSAAWYGPRHLGHRTASGDRLDDIRATAAHRSLPLNSLARVTNLRNGRSVVVKVTDRGPWSSNLLIDVSPKAAEELDMKRAGIVPVKIEPVVQTRPRPQLASGKMTGAD